MKDIPLLLDHNPNRRIGSITLTDEGATLFATMHQLSLSAGGVVLESEVKETARIIKKIRIIEISVSIIES